MFLCSKLPPLKGLMLLKDTGRHTDVPALPQDNTRVTLRGTKSPKPPSAARKHNLCRHRSFTRPPQGPRAGGAGCSSLPSWSGICFFNVFTHLPASLQSCPAQQKLLLLGFWGRFLSAGSAVEAAEAFVTQLQSGTVPWGRRLLLSHNKQGAMTEHCS